MAEVKITEGDWMLANDRKLMKIYKQQFPETHEEMIRQMREADPRCCAECFFYYHLKNKDGTIYGGGCSIDDDVMIMDQLERVADCPL